MTEPAHRELARAPRLSEDEAAEEVLRALLDAHERVQNLLVEVGRLVEENRVLEEQCFVLEREVDALR